MSVKTISKILIFIGIGIILVAMVMDTSVSSGYRRVYNIGLMSQQQNMLIIGGIAFIAGIILFAAIKFKQSPEDELAEKAESDKTIQALVKGVEQKFEKADQLWDSMPNRAFNLLDHWISTKRDNIPGRTAVFLFTAPYVLPFWFPWLILLLGIYAYRPVPASRVLIHLLFLHMTLDLIFAVTFLFSSEVIDVAFRIIMVTVLSGLAAACYLIIRYIRGHGAAKLTSPA